MIPPITIIVASNNPSRRASFGEPLGSADDGLSWITSVGGFSACSFDYRVEDHSAIDSRETSMSLVPVSPDSIV
jgi:hypothetical protein